MRATILYGPRDIRVEDRPDPTILEPTDAIITISAACVCGSDLWPYRGVSRSASRRRWATSTAASSRRWATRSARSSRASSSMGSFFASDNTCPHCRHGYQSSCVHRQFLVRRAGADAARAARRRNARRHAPTSRPTDLVPSLLATSDVIGTGWFAADAANVKPGATVAVVGDGAVGLLGVLSAKQMGAERIIAMSRHPARQKLAREFGATDIVIERGDEGVARIKELTKGIGADSVLECVGTQESMMQAIRATRPGGGSASSAYRMGSRSMARSSSSRHVRSAWRPGAGAPIPAAPDRSRPEGRHRSRQGLRSDAAARPGGGGISGDGRAARDQGAASAVETT